MGFKYEAMQALNRFNGHLIRVNDGNNNSLLVTTRLKVTETALLYTTLARLIP